VLFNSSNFLLYFLPITFAGFLLTSRLRSRRASALWLTGTSFVFYGWWRPENLPLLIGSILFNFWLGGVLLRSPRRSVLVFGIVANVALLAAFKYTGFAIDVANDVLGASWFVPQIILPLAISFFTFQQIAYLVDAHDGAVTEHSFLNYCLFITFFPHLIAGPITHHREMLTQFDDPDRFRPRWDLIAVGITLFLVGLFKKVLVADPFGSYVTPIFAAAQSEPVHLVEAWGGALAYSLQMYFDFSGYTDMAIGLGLLFGISLPPNFNSPYKARNIIDYWARWHMTLTRFLTAYIYNPIVVALTRRRAAKGLPLPKRGRMSGGMFVTLVALPTLLTMFVSGVWHGAGWQFVMFGLLHGFYLVVAHGWRFWKTRQGIPLDSSDRWRIVASVLLTYLCATVALVFFRAPDVPTALNVLAGMLGLNGITLPNPVARLPMAGQLLSWAGVEIGRLTLFDANLAARIILFLFVVWALPNAYQWLRDYPTALGIHPKPSWLEGRTAAARWRPGLAYALAVGGVSTITLLYVFSDAPTEFLYFQF
jgi:D-alanyl-lipoteichoic acid acyltransferase DltB (MBOAT superfamily)